LSGSPVGWPLNWRNDLLDEDRINTSVKLIPKKVAACNSAWKVYTDVMLQLVYPDQQNIRNIFEESCAYILYNWEASNNHMRLGLILALSALYNPAFSLLRNSLELFVKGSFYECLAHEPLRNKISDENFTGILKEIQNFLKSRPSEHEEVEKHSAHIFDIIGQTMEEWRIPFRAFATQVSKLGLLTPPLDVREATDRLKNLYGSLSLNVHVHLDKTDVGRVVGEGGELFEMRPLVNSLQSFLDTWLEVLDVGTVISVNILKGRRNPEETKILLKSVQSSREFAGSIRHLPLTDKLLGKIIH